MFSIMRKLILPGLLAFPVHAGCLEEKDTVTVYPNGSGTIHLHKKFGEQISGMITSFADKNNPQAAIDKTLYKICRSGTGHGLDGLQGRHGREVPRDRGHGLF